jgi:hypothetical protein
MDPNSRQNGIATVYTVKLPILRSIMSSVYHRCHNSLCHSVTRAEHLAGQHLVDNGQVKVQKQASACMRTLTDCLCGTDLVWMFFSMDHWAGVGSDSAAPAKCSDPPFLRTTFAKDHDRHTDGVWLRQAIFVDETFRAFCFRVSNRVRAMAQSVSPCNGSVG